MAAPPVPAPASAGDAGAFHAVPYAEASYWEARYGKEHAPFEWFLGYVALRRVLRAFLSKRKPVLQIGCGTSNVQEGMARSGWTVVNVSQRAGRRKAAARSAARRGRGRRAARGPPRRCRGRPGGSAGARGPAAPRAAPPSAHQRARLMRPPLTALRRAPALHPAPPPAPALATPPSPRRRAPLTTPARHNRLTSPKTSSSSLSSSTRACPDCRTQWRTAVTCRSLGTASLAACSTRVGARRGPRTGRDPGGCAVPGGGGGAAAAAAAC
jgi:hypothetical protein